jgi:hypothetical protein
VEFYSPFDADRQALGSEDGSRACPRLDFTDRRFQQGLRREGCNRLQQRAFLAITPNAAGGGNHLSPRLVDDFRLRSRSPMRQPRLDPLERGH